MEAANGTTGSPTKASRQKGKEYHEHLTMRRVEVVEQLRAANPGECSGAPGGPGVARADPRRLVSVTCF